jgi:hypothetical protein
MTIEGIKSRGKQLLRGCKLAMLFAFVFALSTQAVGVPVVGPAKAASGAGAIKSTTAIHRTPGTVVKNPHLKGVERIATAAKAVVKKKATGEVAHKTLQHRWDYHTWITLHRGLGTIRGSVQSAGNLISSAKVWLRHGNGAAITLVSRKHITFTDSSGSFIMFGVRAGAYHVQAQIGKKHNHSRVVVHPGTMAESIVRL